MFGGGEIKRREGGYMGDGKKKEKKNEKRKEE